MKESLVQPIRYPGKQLTPEEIAAIDKPPSKEAQERFRAGLRSIAEAERRARIESQTIYLASTDIEAS